MYLTLIMKSAPNQGMTASGGVPEHEDQFYGSAIEQRKAPMSTAAPTSNVTQQKQPLTSDIAPATTTGTHSRKDSQVLSDIPPSSYQQTAGQTETAAVPSSKLPSQKVQFTSDAPQPKQASSQLPSTAATAAPATTANANKTDGSYAASQGIA